VIKTAEQILQGRPRPVDRVTSGGPGKGGRPRLNRLCGLPDCGQPHWGHGFCRPHGRKFVLYGDPLHLYRRPSKCLCERCPIHAADTKEEL
jgi:hypothetical protein